MPWIPLVVALVLLVGVGIMLYPSAARWVTDYQQSQAVTGYSTEVDALTAQQRETELQRAREFNESLGSAPIHDPFSTASTPSDVSDTYYQTLATDDGAMARLRIPAIDVEIPVYHGTADETLMRGAGHLDGTALPVGGTGTHSVITAHRGLPEATMFDDLDQVTEGDLIIVETFGETLGYEVTETQVVLPHETQSLYPSADKDQLTLLTCTPLGINTHRLLVTAERTELPEDHLAPPAEAQLSTPWWALVVLTAVGLAAYYVYRQGRVPVDTGTSE
jgi:sortase A